VRGAKSGRPASSDYSDIFDKNKETAATKPESSFDEPEIQKKVSSSSSSDEDDDVAGEKMMQQSSSDSSVSKQKSDQELTRQDAFEVEEKRVAMRRKQSSSEYSESDVEGRKAVDSSSDYDSASNRGRRRPDSMISDASSDYDSISNVGSRRPQSFLLDDDEIITEESEKHSKDDENASSSSEEGPDVKDAGKKVKRIPPPGILKESSGEDEDQDGDDQSTSVPSQILNKPSSSLASSSLFQSSTMHVEQTSVSQTVVDSSSVTISQTLEEVQQSGSSNMSKNMAELTKDQADGSSISGISQGAETSSTTSQED